MNPIERLMVEHRTIEAVMDALDAFVARGQPDRHHADLGRFAFLLREFADAWHHGKEEDILFAAMVDVGFPRNSGPIAVMLQDHDEGRGHVRALAALAAADTSWTDQQRAAVATHAHAFTALLRAHIRKEDQILYPMALQHLPEGAMAAVAQRFDAFEAGPDGDRAQRARELQDLAEELCRRHGTTGDDHAHVP
jgi:hemerythrin-like domain-containing protein